MTHRIGASFSVIGVLLAAPLPAFASEPSFAELLGRARTQLAAGHNWAPPGNNFTETAMAMVDILPLATPEELVALEGLLRQQTVAVTGEFPGDSGTPAATGPAGTKRRDAPVLAPDRLVSTTAIERADHPTDTGQMEIATQDDRHASVDADTAMTRPSSGSVPIAASASPVRPEVVTVPRREPFDLPKAPSLASSVQRALLDRGDTMLSLRDASWLPTTCSVSNPTRL